MGQDVQVSMDSGKPVIFWISNSWNLNTGYAKCCREICKRLSADFEIMHIGQHSLGDAYKPEGWNFTVHPLRDDGQLLLQHQIDQIQPIAVLIQDDLFPLVDEGVHKIDFSKTKLILYCLDKDSLVMTQTGYKKIQDIQKDELVYSVNENTGNLELKPVTNVIHTKSKDWIRFKRKGHDLNVTANHKMLIKDSKDKIIRLAASDLYQLLPTTPQPDYCFVDWKEQWTNSTGAEFFNLYDLFSNSAQIYFIPTKTMAELRTSIKNIYPEFFSPTTHKKTCAEYAHADNKKFYKKTLGEIYSAGLSLEKIDSLNACEIYIKDTPRNQNVIPYRVLMDEFASLIGWYVSEGFIHRNNINGYDSDYIEICQSKTKNKQKFEEIVMLVKKLGFNYSEQKQCIRIFAKTLTDWFETNCGKYSKNKKLPNLNLSNQGRINLFNALISGDGHIGKSGVNYVTISKQLCDQVLTLGTGLGYSGCVDELSENKCFGKTHKRPIYTVRFIKPVTEYMVKSNLKEETLDYDKDAYCIEVADNHNFLATSSSKFRPIVVGNCAIDGEPLADNSHQILDKTDKIVAMSEWGKSIIEADGYEDVSVIYHGVDTSVWKPITDIEKRTEELQTFLSRILGKKVDLKKKFVVFTSGRNTLRKNIPDAIHAFMIFATGKKDVRMVIHSISYNRGDNPLSLYVDIFAKELGWSKEEVAEKILFYPAQSFQRACPESQMITLSSVADVYFTMAWGEGFGMQMLEAMSVGTCVISSEYSTPTELVGDERGMLVKTDRLVYVQRGIAHRIPNIDDAVMKLNTAYKLWQKGELKKKYSANCIGFANKYTWDAVCLQWKKLIHEVTGK